MKKAIFILCLVLLIMSCSKMDVAEPGLLVPKTVDQDANLPSLLINGTLLHVESFGNPDDAIVIILHGGPGGDYRSMLKARILADDGFFVVFYDQRGSGLSQRVDKNIFDKEGSINIYFDDLKTLIEHFRQNENQKVFLAGHSWGAMLATGFVNKYPHMINGVILAEPGGFTWDQTLEYMGRSNHIKFFSEALNDAIFPEQIFAGRSEDEVLDYKASFFSEFENAPGNTIGNAGSYPFWRNGSAMFLASSEYGNKYGFDFTTDLNSYTTKVLFLYSEYNKAYGLEWAKTVSRPYSEVEIQMVKGCGHEMFYFGWDDMYSRVLTYLNELK